jgi:hypothetical protein
LWRLFQRVETPSETNSRIPLLFDYHKDAEQDVERLEIMKGLFGTHREGSERRLRALYFIKVQR